MRWILVGFLIMFGATTAGAQEKTFTFENSGIVFSGENRDFSKDHQYVKFTGNVHFSTDLVQIEQADKIVYDRKNKTFTISGFKELRLNGEKKLASDLGPTTLKLDLGNNRVVYLIASDRACPDGKKAGC